MLHAASTLREDGSSKDSDGDWDFLVAWDGSIKDELAELALDVEARASIVLTTWSAAEERKARGRRLAAELAVQAAESSLSGASEAIGVLVQTTVGTAKGANQDNVFFIDSVVTGHG